MIEASDDATWDKKKRMNFRTRFRFRGCARDALRVALGVADRACADGPEGGVRTKGVG